MPIRIDLLSQAREKHASRRRKPMMRALGICGVLLGAVVLWMLKLGLDVGRTEAAFNGIERVCVELRPQVTAASNDLIKITQIDRKLAALDRLATNRFFWAPLLSALEQTFVNDIQVLRVSSVQISTVEAPRARGGASKREATPTNVVERLSLSIEGKDTSADTQACERYKDRLNRCDYFVKNLKSRDGFVLVESLRVRPADASGPSGQYTQFLLTSQFPDARRGE